MKKRLKYLLVMFFIMLLVNAVLASGNTNIDKSIDGGKTATIGSNIEVEESSMAFDVIGTAFYTLPSPPTITSFTPLSGPVGTLVTITGTNLDSPTALSIGGADAISISNDGTTLVAMLMPGAITGTVDIGTSGGTATSSGSFTIEASVPPEGQQGDKLVGTDGSTRARQGLAVSISADGNTALVGGPYDNGYKGAVWIYARTGGIWSQQGEKLVEIGSEGEYVQLGESISISADGNTALVGGPGDNDEKGAVWVFTRTGSTWSQQGDKLVGTGVAPDPYDPGSVGAAYQGSAVSISADGNTALVGGDFDNGAQGAVWVFTRKNSTWSQQGEKLVGTGSVGDYVRQGSAVSISVDGNTAMVGGGFDNDGQGAVWVFTRTDSTWSQQGNKLVGTGSVGDYVRQGRSVSISADGNTALVGGPGDNDGQGAVWVFTRTDSTWSQQGNKLVGTGNEGAASQGKSVSLSADGNTALVGGPYDGDIGAAWLFTRTDSTWYQAGNKVVGTGNQGKAFQSFAVSLSADGGTALLGGFYDNSKQGAVWVFNGPPSPEINLKGNNQNIANGANSPSISDSTDFGSVGVTGLSNTNTFTIENIGTATLNLNGTSDTVVLSGSSDFTVSRQATSPISTSGSTTFKITFNPSSIGLKTATVSIANDDGDENPYTFAISGMGECDAGSSPTVNITGSDSLTCTVNSVTRTASAGGASYSWSNGLGTNQLATVSSAGIYTVTVTASNGCTVSGTTAVVFKNDLVVTASNDGPYNEKDNVNLLATGGPSYSWTGPNGFRSTLTAPSIGNVTPENAGNYTVTVQNGACSGTATTEVNIDCSAPGMTYYLVYSGINPEIIAQLVPGLKVQYSATRPMSVIALNNCQLPIIESLKFQLSGTSNTQYYVDNNMPFRAHETNGESSGDILLWNRYSFQSRGYDQDYALGNMIVGPDVIQFNIVAGDGEISVPTLSTNALCAGTSLTVSANQTGSFDVGNVFQAYLSDAHGSFMNPVLIGTSANPDSIACTLPNYLLSSEDYKVMIRSSSPLVLSLGSTANLSITSPSVNLISPLNDMLNLTKNEQAGLTMNASNKIDGSSKVTYKAGNYISLEPGFSSGAGTVFKAKIENVCLD